MLGNNILKFSTHFMEYPVYFKNEGKNAREENTPTVNFPSHSRKCALPLEKNILTKHMTLHSIFQEHCLKVIQVRVLINSSYNKTNKCTNVKIDLIVFGKPVKCHTFKVAVLIKTFLHRCPNPSLIRYATHTKTCGPHSYGILFPFNNNNR
jgi:hypothetical protein